MSPSGPLRGAPPPDGRADTRSRRNHGYRRRLREGLQRARRERAARVLHRARQLHGHLLRRAAGAVGPAGDVRAHVPVGQGLRLADGPRGGVAGHGGGRVDVLLRRDRRGAAERRPQGRLPRHERLRAGEGTHRALPRVLRHGRGAAPARFRAGLYREGARPPGRLMPPRLAFLDVFRGFALIVMVLNHTGRWWIAREMGWWRYWIVYGTVTVAAPIFLFLVGFVLPLSLHRHAGDIVTPSRLWNYWRRGATIVAAGLLLNVIVFGSIHLRSLSPEDSPLAGGGLQTIGLSIIFMTPTAALLRWSGGRAALLRAALVGYLGFLLAYEPLQNWPPNHPLIALTLFLDYPPWPWICLVLVGLVLGWWWRDVAARGPDAPFFRNLAVVGVMLMALAVLAELGMIVACVAMGYAWQAIKARSRGWFF